MDFHMSDPAVQTADVTVREQRQRKGEEILDHLTYWKQKLGDAPLTLDLPTDHPHLLKPSLLRAQYSFVLPLPLSVKLKAFSQQEEVSLYITLLAAFQALLYRYTGQDDLLVGIPGMENHQDKINGSEYSKYGLANILVIRTRMLDNPSFRSLIQHVRDIVLEAHAHQDVPFEQLVKALQRERSPGRHPLCQVMFAMDETGETDLSPYTKGMALENGIVKLDLLLAVLNATQELHVRIEYNVDLFEEATIARMMGHWQMLLEGLVANPDQHISVLPLLSEAERQQLLVEWNATQTEYLENNMCIHQLFEAQVESRPDAIAVIYEDEQLTYRELNQRANQLAHYLQKMGVGPEVLVGLCVERSLEMIVGMLGILKAGGAYVPLDPTYPKKRLTFLLEDSQTPVLLTQKRLLEGLPGLTARVICLDTDWETIAQESLDNVATSIAPENLVYVIYTSGSTGNPKGVLITHRSLVNYALYARNRYELRSEDRILQFASISFDASAEEVYPCLISGATLILRTDSMLSSVATFLQKCEEWAITVIDLPTAYWHELTFYLETNAGIIPSVLRVVIIGGEQALLERLAAWQRKVDRRVRLFNTYGPTETTITVTAVDLTEALEDTRTPNRVSIGRPVANIESYILDAQLQPVPIGLPGDLYFGGVGLATGYRNRPDLTAEKFIPHPFSSEAGARLYKTGDIARYLPTGNIEFLGRLDHQVKLRGYRIELGEIEAALVQHPDVQEGVVVFREDVPDDKRLIAYVVPNRKQTPTSSGLRSVLRERLPYYMVPSAFVLLESLPLTPNGKLDRRALPAPNDSRSEEEETFAAPTLPVHQQLTQIWEELLGVRHIGIRDNFFELGGHSLLAVRLVGRIEQVWGKKISSTTLLAGPTIEQLADVLGQPEDTHSDRASSSVKTSSSRRSFPSLRRLLTSLTGTTRHN